MAFFRDQARGPEHRINERIRARFVRLIDETGQNHGSVQIGQALAMAREKGLDLVEMQANANPPVCRIMDYGKFRYEQKKQKKAAKKKHHTQEEKEIRFRVTTAVHDVETKIRHARHFLEEGDKVIFSILLRGRDFSHLDMASAIFKKVKEQLAPVSKIEMDVKRDGNRMMLVLLPLPESQRKRPAPAAKPAAPKPAAPPPEPPKVEPPPESAAAGPTG